MAGTYCFHVLIVEAATRTDAGWIRKGVFPGKPMTTLRPTFPCPVLCSLHRLPCHANESAARKFLGPIETVYIAALVFCDHSQSWHAVVKIKRDGPMSGPIPPEIQRHNAELSKRDSERYQSK